MTRVHEEKTPGEGHLVMGAAMAEGLHGIRGRNPSPVRMTADPRERPVLGKGAGRPLSHPKSPCNCPEVPSSQGLGPRSPWRVGGPILFPAHLFTCNGKPEGKKKDLKGRWRPLGPDGFRRGHAGPLSYPAALTSEGSALWKRPSPETPPLRGCGCP